MYVLVLFCYVFYFFVLMDFFFGGGGCECKSASIFWNANDKILNNVSIFFRLNVDLYSKTDILFTKYWRRGGGSFTNLCFCIGTLLKTTYTVADREPLPLSDPIYNVYNFERKEKNLFSSSLHSLGIIEFFHIHSLTKLTCIKTFIYLAFQISISIYEQYNYK